MAAPEPDNRFAESLIPPSWASPRSNEGRPIPRYRHGSRVPGWDDAVDPEKHPAGVPDPATTFVPADLRAEIEELMARYPDRRSAALPALAAAQRLHGWCSPLALDQVACVMRLTPAYLNSVASFYDMLDTEPVGRHRVYVCTNISCSLNGADELYERFVERTDGDEDFEVRHFECLGACDIAPMASFDGVYVGPIAIDEVDTVLDQVRRGEPPLPDKQMARRMSTDPNANSQEFARPAEAQRAVALGTASQPTLPPEETTFGPAMTEPTGGAPTAAIEQTPEHAEDDDS